LQGYKLKREIEQLKGTQGNQLCDSSLEIDAEDLLKKQFQNKDSQLDRYGEPASEKKFFKKQRRSGDMQSLKVQVFDVGKNIITA